MMAARQARARAAKVFTAVPSTARPRPTSRPAAVTTISSSRTLSALADTAAPQTIPFRPVDNRKGVVVVGAGRMGHIRADGVMANPGTFMASIVDPDENKAKALAEHASVPAYW